MIPDSRKQLVTESNQSRPPHQRGGKSTKWTPERVQQITNLVERGKSREEIAEIIGVTPGTLQVTCSKLGISLRQPKFGNGIRLQRRRLDRQEATPAGESGSQRESTSPKSRAQPNSERTLVKEIRSGTTNSKLSQPRSNDPASAIFAIRMEYKGEDRLAALPLDDAMVKQLALEAEFRGMRMSELVSALIVAITSKDLFQLVLKQDPCSETPA